MTHGHTIESLILFEQRVADAFEAKQVKGPIHLCSGTQAEPLLKIFEEIGPEDWVFSTWRSHWHCLLKGVPEDEVFAAILAGRSMYLNFAKQRVVCSAIVGGILPIALGVSMGLREWEGERLPRVHVFIGDMTERTGLYHEFAQYAAGHSLPVRVHVEDNGLSTNAVTEQTWGRDSGQWPRVDRYTYRRTRPHTGTGRHVTF